MLLPNFRRKIFIMAFFRNLLFKQEINHPIIIAVRNSLINGKYEGPKKNVQLKGSASKLYENIALVYRNSMVSFFPRSQHQ